MAVLELTRIFEQPSEALYNYLCKLPHAPHPGTRVVLDRPTLELLVEKLDEAMEKLAASPDDAEGRIDFNRTTVVCLERLVFLCRFMAHDNVSFDVCKYGLVRKSVEMLPALV